MFVTEFGAK